MAESTSTKLARIDERLKTIDSKINELGKKEELYVPRTEYNDRVGRLE